MINKKISSVKNHKTSGDQLVRDRAFKSRKDLDEFYLKNKMKLPPIFQSRNFLIEQLNIGKVEKIEEKVNETTEKSNKPIQKSETKTNGCKIMFQKHNPTKFRRDYLMSPSSILKFQKQENQEKSQNSRKNISKMIKTLDMVDTKNRKDLLGQKRSVNTEDALQKLLNKIAISKELVKDQINQDELPFLKSSRRLNSVQLKPLELEQNRGSELKLHISKLSRINPQLREQHQSLQRQYSYRIAKVEEIKTIIKKKNMQVIEHATRSPMNREYKLQKLKNKVHQQNSLLQKFEEIGEFEPWEENKSQLYDEL